VDHKDEESLRKLLNGKKKGKKKKNNATKGNRIQNDGIKVR
jgi:hypothetical protein